MKNLKDLKIAYIGGGSRGWARTLMNDLASEELLGGTVNLYDIDMVAAEQNEQIGNQLSSRQDVKGKWKYVTFSDINSALKGADFVVISVLPGTFDEMESDVHEPEKYGIYQSVGDTTGPGGIVRALRTVPMFMEFAKAIEKNCPDAWVINFTNPMSICVRTLYKVFPKIKAFGCCHEVFGTQNLLQKIYQDKFGEKVTRDDIKINVFGVNHFTWIDRANCKGVNLIKLYDEYIEEHKNEIIENKDENWANNYFANHDLVKFDLFKRYGIIAAAGDRHLAEFCPAKWYLKDLETINKFGFAITPVSWRKKDLENRINATKELLDGKPFNLINSGEEFVRQIKALLGITPLTTNINIPNQGQIKNLPLGAVVETNACIFGDTVQPVYAGEIPMSVNALIYRVCVEQETVVEAALTGNYELAFNAFINSQNVNLDLDDARKLFDQMLYNTKKYLPAYENYISKRKV